MPQRFRDAEHLVRLALLMFVGVLLFLVIRTFFVPADFGELGHFRTGTLQDNRNLPLHYAGRASCGQADCHEEEVASLASDTHASVGCESCHGALAAHAADPKLAKAATVEANVLCARCHVSNWARPEDFPQVEIETHRQGEEDREEEEAGVEECTECHDSHEPTS
jgi:hypothetical protein